MHASPNPAIKHPIPMHPRVGFLKPLVDAANIEIGEFTYYDDPLGPDGPDARSKGPENGGRNALLPGPSPWPR